MPPPQSAKNDAAGLKFVEQMCCATAQKKMEQICYMMVHEKTERVLLRVSSQIRHMRLAEQKKTVNLTHDTVLHQRPTLHFVCKKADRQH